jgi:hypothetical protein
MVHCQDAPALEREFHARFADRQVNRINQRREFFRVSLDEIAEFAKSKQLQLELTAISEAREYRQTLALLKQASQSATSVNDGGVLTSAFPEKLF